jgi:DNA mismatch endonuclease, patch repair protein
VDHLSRLERSKLMRKIRSQATKPEAAVEREARRIKRNFKMNSKRLAGKPDLAFFRLRRAVFVHGCFWHQHRNCKRSNIPKSNQAYWGPKLARNVQRDREVRKRLKAAGWQVLVIWECKCNRSNYIHKTLNKFLSAPKWSGRESCL